MENIQPILQEHYQIEIANLIEMQGGWAALAYKVESNKQRYFLKIYEKRRASTPKWTALIDKYVPITDWLKHHSALKGKIPVPLVTKNGDYMCEDEEGIYLLYHYIDGVTVGANELTEEQVDQLAEVITELHSYGEEIPVETAPIKEDFSVPFLQSLETVLGKEYPHLPDEIREVIDPYRKRVRHLLEAVAKLADSLKNSDLRMVLCHTDLHNWNLMHAEQQLILIDWEGLRLAPVEADMIFFVDKPYFHQFLGTYQQVHQDFSIHPSALRFYQGRRKLEDIWEFIEQLLWDKQDVQERAKTIQSLKEELK